MTSFIHILLVSLLFLASALALPLDKRDVVDPPVTTPNTTTVWTSGSSQLVVWDTSKLPPYNQITNKVGRIVLGFLDSNGENLMLDKPLANGFNITQGSIQVVVPNVPTRKNYIIVVMGDSGNASPMFTILNDQPSLIGGSIPPDPTPSGPPPTADSTTPVSSATIGGPAAATPSSSLALTNPGGAISSAITPSSSATTVIITNTSSAATQATSTASNSATQLRRGGATCFCVAFVLASLLL